MAIDLGDQSHFTIAVDEKPLDDFVSDRQRRPSLDHSSRIVPGCETSNRFALDFEKATRVLGSHRPDGNGHCSAS